MARKQAARTTSVTSITETRPWRSPKVASTWPRPTKPARLTAVTAAAHAGEPVRSKTSTASASRPAQSPRDEMTSALQRRR
jgi:hypothetical protein